MLLFTKLASYGGIRGSGGYSSRNSSGTIPSTIPEPEYRRNKYNGLTYKNILVILVYCATGLSQRPKIYTVYYIKSGVIALISLVTGVSSVTGKSIGLKTGLL